MSYKVERTTSFSRWAGRGRRRNGLGRRPQRPTSSHNFARRRNAGARYIVVSNLPDIGRTPAGTARGAAGVAALSGLSVQVFNSIQYGAQLDRVRRDSGEHCRHPERGRESECVWLHQYDDTGYVSLDPGAWFFGAALGAGASTSRTSAAGADDSHRAEQD